MSNNMNVPGYEPLADILTAAYTQAAVGKGAERHAGGQPFDQQPMQSISDLFNTPYGMAFQVAKKLHEGIKMDTLERQERELLGVIVYTAGIVLWLRRQAERKSPQGELALGVTEFKDVSLEQEIEAKVAAAGGWVNVPYVGWPKHPIYEDRCQVGSQTPTYYKHALGHLGFTDSPEYLDWNLIVAYKAIRP